MGAGKVQNYSGIHERSSPGRGDWKVSELESVRIIFLPILSKIGKCQSKDPARVRNSDFPGLSKRCSFFAYKNAL